MVYLVTTCFLDIGTWFFLKYVSKEICQYDNFVKVFFKKKFHLWIGACINAMQNQYILFCICCFCNMNIWRPFERRKDTLKRKKPNETAIHRLLKWFQIQIIINFGVCTNEAIAVDLVTI